MPVAIFLSYAHSDRNYLTKLELFLVPFRLVGLIEIMYDISIGAGKVWKQAIDEKLLRADIVLLLITQRFLDSKECKRELELALKQKNKPIVIPILFESVDDLESLPFSHLQMLPAPSKPVVNWEKPDEAWNNIVKGIGRIILGHPKNLPSGVRSEQVLRPFSTVSDDIKNDLESASHIWLLSRTGMGWWRDFNDQILKLTTKKGTRFLLLDPGSPAFEMGKHFWKPGPWSPTTNFYNYREAAESFLGNITKTHLSLKLLKVIVRLVVLITFPRNKAQPTIYVEYPTFSSSYQAKPIVKITSQEMQNITLFRNAYNELWKNHGYLKEH